MSKILLLCFITISTSTFSFNPPVLSDIIIIEQGRIIGNQQEIIFISKTEEDLVTCIEYEDGTRKPIPMTIKAKKHETVLLEIKKKYRLIRCNPKELIRKFNT